MKPSEKKLGLTIQLLLMRNGLHIDDLARQMGITADALSNLIHGRRGFKNDTLVKLSECAAIRQAGLTLPRLRALRAMDDYSFEELLLALMEYIKQGGLEHVSQDFYQRLERTMAEEGGSPALTSKTHALLALIQAPFGA